MCYSKFSFDFKDLNAVINSFGMLAEKERGIVEVSIKANKRLVFVLNEHYGNWELGFQKKKNVQKRRAVLVDLENDDVEGNSAPRLRAEVMKADYEEEFNRFEHFKFKKIEDYEIIIEQLIEFERDVLENYPFLRVEIQGEKKGNEGGEIDDHFLKRHIEIFRYMTFQMGFDQERRSVARIAKIRQYADDLAACDEIFDVNLFIKNEKKIYDYCKIPRAARDAARNSAEQRRESSSSTSVGRTAQTQKNKKN